MCKYIKELWGLELNSVISRSLERGDPNTMFFIEERDTFMNSTHNAPLDRSLKPSVLNDPKIQLILLMIDKSSIRNTKPTVIIVAIRINN